MIRVSLLLLAFSLSAMLSCCAVVHQIDRKNLSTRKMQFEPEPARRGALEEFHSIREGASGGTGQSAGGGCGCN